MEEIEEVLPEFWNSKGYRELLSWMHNHKIISNKLKKYLEEYQYSYSFDIYEWLRNQDTILGDQIYINPEGTRSYLSLLRKKQSHAHALGESFYNWLCERLIISLSIFGYCIATEKEYKAYYYYDPSDDLCTSELFSTKLQAIEECMHHLCWLE